MWQLYALSAIALACLENITDKRAMTGVDIDADIATFVRELLFCLLVVPITSILGNPVTWYCSPGVILFGLSFSYIYGYSIHACADKNKHHHSIYSDLRYSAILIGDRQCNWTRFFNHTNICYCGSSCRRYWVCT